jgi:hypothetical protein
VLKVTHLVGVVGFEANRRLRGHYRGAFPYIASVTFGVMMCLGGVIPFEKLRGPPIAARCRE